MSKQDIHLFFASFAITLLFFGFISAFLLVDSNASRRERGSTEQLWAAVKTEPGHWQLTLLGKNTSLSLSSLRPLSEAYTRYASILAPRGLYSLDAASDYSVYWFNEFYKKYKEELYQQETGSFSERKLPPETI